MRLHIFLILLIISLSACSSQESIAPTVIEQKISDKGVTLSPKSFNAEDFSSFFVKAKEAGDYVSWSGNWNELSNKEKILDLRMRSLDKQETRQTEQLEKLREEIMKTMKK